MLDLLLLALVSLGLLAACAAQGASAPVLLSAPRTVPKPNDAVPERRARKQPTAPEGYKELPFIEQAPEPELTADEKTRGYLLFGRPITEPVYPNTHPLPHERLEALVGFATPGEFEPLTFSLYPVRALENLRVRVSDLVAADGTIPAAAIDVNLGAYWNVGFPRYTSRETFRRTPELLEPATVHSSPARECQRWWLRVHVPSDARPGLYRGAVTLWDDGFAQALEVPVALRVLGFPLKKDPAKHFSAYYYVRNGVAFEGRDEAFIQKAAANEYRAMVDYGLDMLPTLILRCDDGNTITLDHEEELPRMLAAGLRGPVPVTADRVIAYVYAKLTPGGKRGSHWKIDKPPPPEFYTRLTELFKAFEVRRKAKGWPEFICCPMDEVDASSRDFGVRVFAAVRAAGLRTYATKNPLAADAAAYRPCLDIWCSQPYSMPFEKIAAQRRYEFWSYPNHNAGENKERLVMCKGGRMTYGFGFWRSGYTTLIPWHWSWTPPKDPFDYLRGAHSGCGQRIDDDGAILPAVYWECFREGYDDGRYLYTLQQAVVEREDSAADVCKREVAGAKALLQETWDAIRVQEKYQATGMWPSEEFNARRWRIAQAIGALLRFPAAREAVAPSVLVANPEPKAAAQGDDALEKALKAGLVETLDLGGDYGAWRNSTKEGQTEVMPAAGLDGAPGLRWTVNVDHQLNGGDGGNYAIGWPRVGRDFEANELDISGYDYLAFMVRVDSNRDEVADDSTPVNVILNAQARKSILQVTRDLGDRQREWLPLRFSIPEMMQAAAAGAEPWKSITRVQFWIAESNYAHGTRLVFDLGQIALLRFKTPVLASADAPRYVVLPSAHLPVGFEVMGAGSVKPGSHGVTVSLQDEQGRQCAERSADLAAARDAVLDLKNLKPGRYRLRVVLAGADGKVCSETAQPLEALAGPLYEP
ncbi:MAG: hypothetical protein M5U26_17485 [Planctomycetota bacterium]|nr:hypothetical protein [Planctomycetota bacterium]